MRPILVPLFALSVTMGIGAATLRGSGNGPVIHAWPTGTDPIPRSLESGQRIGAIIEHMLTSHRDRSGESIRAAVRGDIRDSSGNVVIPAASTLMLTIVQLKSGSASVRNSARLRLAVRSVTIDGRVYPITARLESVAHRLQGRGIGRPARDEHGNIVAGFRYAYHDVIVAAGTRIAFTLTRPLSIPAH